MAHNAEPSYISAKASWEELRKPRLIDCASFERFCGIADQHCMISSVSWLVKEFVCVPYEVF